MFLESEPGARGYQPGSPRQRAISMALSLAIILLVLLAAILGGTVVPNLIHQSNPTTFDIAPGKTNKSKSKEKASNAKQTKPEVKKHENTHEKTPSQAPVPTPDVKADKPPPLSFIKMSSQDFASADIAGLPKAGGSSSASKSSGGGASYGPGEGLAAKFSIMRNGIASQPMPNWQRMFRPRRRVRAGA
ncbi:hypothetical protein [Novosphingobium sp. 9]|uniref:hypothetical protein n=1 Tax=Novosphingobium sp. 9 TaxID=2025349 RepID=UPI0021B55FDB|nr:hypothetical protein [Novosphingobium sp. 9]